MQIIHRHDNPEFMASDGSLLREWLHPARGTPADLPFSVASARVKPGARTSRHVLDQTEVYLLLCGEALMHVDDECERVVAGDAIVIPAGAPQWIENTGAGMLEFLAIVCPPWYAEGDRNLE